VSGLAGRTVVVTRPRAQADAFAAALEAAGARVLVCPSIDIRPADDPGPVDRAIARLEDYAWVVFTSANAVRHFWDRLAAAARGGLPAGVRAAAVGRATGAALEERGCRVDAMPDAFVGTQLPAALGDIAGRPVLLPRADIGREATLEALVAAGAAVDAVTVYHTVPAALDAAALAAFDGGVDAITFTSPSTFRNLLALLTARGRSRPADAALASIGPVTSAAIREAGYAVAVEPAEHTADGLLDALETYFTSHAVGAAGDRS